MSLEKYAEKRRSPESWTPFMEELHYRIRRSRKRRLYSSVFAVVTVIVFSLIFTLSLRNGDKREDLVSARIPSLEEPTFTPTGDGTPFICKVVAEGTEMKR